MQLNKVDWTEKLLVIKPEVERLFYKGSIDLFLNDSPKLAIVGSRRMTDYGAKVIEKWMPILVQKGVTIVSGFMYGVDQTAHKTCLENGGKTIAVLGWGIDWQVAEQDKELYQKIIDSDSLIVSEYEKQTVPELWMFPQRNRIVAGIADAVLVVEGAEKSGSMITARLANQFDTPLLALPGPIFSKVSVGTNNLIKSGQAKLVSSADDVLAAMDLLAGQMKMFSKSSGNSVLKNPVLEVLERGEKSADELSRILKMPVEILMNEIFELELSGLVESKSGKYTKTI